MNKQNPEHAALGEISGNRPLCSWQTSRQTRPVPKGNRTSMSPTGRGKRGKATGRADQNAFWCAAKSARMTSHGRAPWLQNVRADLACAQPEVNCPKRTRYLSKGTVGRRASQFLRTLSTTSLVATARAWLESFAGAQSGGVAMVRSSSKARVRYRNDRLVEPND